MLKVVDVSAWQSSFNPQSAIGIDAPGATPAANQIFMISSLTKYVN